MIHRPLHSGPYTEDSSEDRKYPESSLTHSPPLIYRLHLVDGHDGVGDEIEDEEIVQNRQRLRFKAKIGISCFRNYKENYS